MLLHSLSNPEWLILPSHTLLEKSLPKKLRAKSKNEVCFEALAGAKHGDSVFASQENLNKIFAFLDRHLK